MQNLQDILSKDNKLSTNWYQAFLQQILDNFNIGMCNSFGISSDPEYMLSSIITSSNQAGNGLTGHAGMSCFSSDSIRIL
jgi:hypothetical protein